MRFKNNLTNAMQLLRGSLRYIWVKTYEGVRLVRFDGTEYFLQDGFHRVEAARREGMEELEAEIKPGTLAEMESEFREYVRALWERL